MTNDELRAVALLARAEPMLTPHVLTLADGVLRLLDELLELHHQPALIRSLMERVGELEKQLAAMRLTLMDRR